MKDWKPDLYPGYTGRRHDDRNAETGGWFSLMGISFFVGTLLGVVITLGYMGIPQ